MVYQRFHQFAISSILLVVIWLHGMSRVGWSQNMWTNPGTGASAGNWFVGTNWSTAVVPGQLEIAIVGNGGEAKAAGPNVVSVNRLEIGKDAGIGRLTNSGAAISVGVDFDIGEIGGTFAAGPIRRN